MTFCTQIVTVAAVLIGLALCVPVQAKTLQDDALRARAEKSDADAQYNLVARKAACRLRDEGLTGTYG